MTDKKSVTEEIRVLVIDDDQEDISLVKELLSETDGSPFTYKIDSVNSFVDALKALVRNTHDVFLLDYTIPGIPLNGIDILKRANAGGCTSPVILFTGLADDFIDWAAEEAGAAGYLNKNLDLTERTLKHAIRYAVRHFKQLKETNQQLQIVQAQLADISRKLRLR